MAKKLALVLFSFHLLAAQAYPAAQERIEESQHVSTVRRLVLGRLAGITIGRDYKLHLRLGDQAARALAVLAAEEPSLTPAHVDAYLYVIETAFRQPDHIAAPRDRTPRYTFVFLGWLEEHAPSPQLKTKVAEARRSLETHTSKDVVNKLVPPFRVHGVPPPVLLRQLAAEYQIPVGLEQPFEEPAQPVKVSLSFQGGTVGDLFDEFVKVQPDYGWGVVDGVINVFPSSMEASPLEAGVMALRAQGIDAADVMKTLTELPEVKTGFSRFGIVRVEVKRFTSDGEKLNLNMDNLSVRQVLNRAVRANGTLFWLVSRRGAHHDILTITL